MYRKKSNTKLTPDQILDAAADILAEHGVVHGDCYDEKTGGHCALGAIARAVYPRATRQEITDLSYVNDYDDNLVDRRPDPSHVAAVEFLGNRLTPRYPTEEFQARVFNFNDSQETITPETKRIEDEWGGYEVNLHSPFLTVKSSKKVVAKLRSAAKAYRAKAAKANA